MTIIIPLFDCFGFTDRVRLHIAAVGYYTSLGYDVVTVEAVSPNCAPSIAIADARHRHIVVTYYDKILLQFNLFNIGIRAVTDPYLMCCDSDARIPPGMLVRAEDMLRVGIDVLQPFSHIEFMASDGTVSLPRPGRYYSCMASATTYRTSYAGLAIGLSRAYFDRVEGLFDRLVCGAADLLLCCGVRGDSLPFVLSYPECAAYAQSAHGIYDVVPGCATHLWHPETPTAYVHVNRMLRQSGFSPAMLEYTEEGVLKWKDAYRDTYGKYVAEKLSDST